MDGKKPKKGKPRATASRVRGLNARQLAFCQAYVQRAHGTWAATKAGYSAKSAAQMASELLKVPNVLAEMQRIREAAANRVEITVASISQQYQKMASANPNDIMEVRRICCRYCHGKDHKYQYKAREWENVLADNQEDVETYEIKMDHWRENGAKGKPPKKPDDVPDPKGGIGFDPRKDPHENCPECFGEGLLDVFWKDTRHLPPESLRLYAGVKQTKDGFEIKMNDPMAALDKLADHVGLAAPKRVEQTGADGAPLIPPMVAMSEDERKTRTARALAIINVEPD